MKNLFSRIGDGIERSIPSLKKFGKGAGVAAFLFPIAAFAMGYIAGLYGLPVPQADASGLQSFASSYVPFIEGGED